MTERIFKKSTLLKSGAFFMLFFLLAAAAEAQLHSLSFKDFRQLSEFFTSSEHRIPLISAHRGGAYSGYPENAIETFEYTIQQIHAIIECDVRMTRDSVLVLLHDRELDRTTTCSGPVDTIYSKDLENCHLRDANGAITKFKVPTLMATLSWSKKKTILMLDVKRGIDFESVIREVKKAKAANRVAIITYTADAAQKVYNMDNELMISATIRNLDEWKMIEDRKISPQNILAFVGTREPEKELYELLRGKGIFSILGTMGNLDKKAESGSDEFYHELTDRGADMLSTDRPIEAYRSIMEGIPANSPNLQYLKNYK